MLERRDRQRYTSRVGGIPDLLRKLKNAPDFYVEMKWEFTSWVPFLSRMCPSDTYKVYKQGSNVRIDTTLLGFDQTNWVRGSRTYVFSGRENGADLYEIDHDTRTVYCEEMRLLSYDELESYVQSDDQISARLTTPLVLTFLDTDKINFERSRGGFWGWGSERSEVVNGYDSKVFGAHNVELVTKTRTEHLTEEDKKRAKSNKNPLQSFLGMAEVEVKQAVQGESGETSEYYSANNPCCISPEEYFSEADLKGRDIGRPREMTCRVQKFQAQLWLCEDFPLSLQEQVMPIVDLMAISNTHFQKLKDFITCSFPSGFPVKIEIPLFHVINARITFGNIFGLTNGVTGITVVKEEGEECRLSCAVDDSVFEIPTDYSRVGGQSSNQVRRQYEDDDDQLLQYALRQSVNNSDGVIPDAIAREEVDIWEALQVLIQYIFQGPSKTVIIGMYYVFVCFSQAQAPSSQQPAPSSSMASSNGAPVGMAGGRNSGPRQTFEDQQLEISIQRAIELSLKANNQPAAAAPGDDNPAEEAPVPPATAGGNDDEDLSAAIRLSQQEQDDQARRQREEEELLQKVLELSMREQ